MTQSQADSQANINPTQDTQEINRPAQIQWFIRQIEVLIIQTIVKNIQETVIYEPMVLNNIIKINARATHHNIKPIGSNNKQLVP